jgi:hypothetical protein
LRNHCVVWGGEIQFHGKKIELINTCTCDNFQMAMWALSHLQPNFYHLLPQVLETNALVQMIESVDMINPADPLTNFRNQWNKAKAKFILDIVMQSHLRPQININDQMDFFGSEYGKFIVHLAIFQLHNVIQICSTGCLNDGAIIKRKEHLIYINKIGDNVVFQSMWSGLCKECRTEFDTT